MFMFNSSLTSKVSSKTKGVKVISRAKSLNFIGDIQIHVLKEHKFKIQAIFIFEIHWNSLPEIKDVLSKVQWHVNMTRLNYVENPAGIINVIGSILLI